MFLYWPFAETTPRRIKELRISADLLLTMWGGLKDDRVIVCDNPLPEGTKVVGLALDEHCPAVIRLFIEHESFPVLLAGSTPTATDWLRFTAHYLPTAALGGIKAVQEVLDEAVILRGDRTEPEPQGALKA